MLETPVTSNPEVVNFLSNLPAYRTGVSPLLRGVEVGLAHGFLLPGPFIKVGCMAGLQLQRQLSCSKQQCPPPAMPNTAAAAVVSL
jgi:photosystem I subunit 11